MWTFDVANSCTRRRVSKHTPNKMMKCLKMPETSKCNQDGWNQFEWSVRLCFRSCEELHFMFKSGTFRRWLCYGGRRGLTNSVNLVSWVVCSFSCWDSRGKSLQKEFEPDYSYSQSWDCGDACVNGRPISRQTEREKTRRTLLGSQRERDE